MKNAATFFPILVFVLALTISGCKKDNATTTTQAPPIITADQLYGTWNFINFQYKGVNYTNQTEISNSSNDSVRNSASLLSVDFLTNSQYTCGCAAIPGQLGAVSLISPTYNNPQNPFTMNYLANQIILPDEWVWQVLSYTASTNTMELKLISNIGTNDAQPQPFLINGILTVQK